MSFGLGRHGSRSKTPFLELDSFIHIIDCETIWVHKLHKVALISIKHLDLCNNFTHLVLILALSGTNAFSSVNPLGELALAGVTTWSGHTTFTNLSSVLDQAVLLVTFVLDRGVLCSHFPIKVLLGWLLENIFLCRRFWNWSISLKRYLFVLRSIHVVILVNPRVLVLLLFLTVITALISILLAFATTAFTAVITTVFTSWLLGLFVTFGSVCGLSCSSGSTTTSSNIGTTTRSVVVSSISATTATAGCLGSGVASISGCTIGWGSCGSVSRWLSVTATTALRLFYCLCFSHCCTIYKLF